MRQGVYMGVSPANLKSVFSHHPAETPAQLAAYEAIREAGAAFASTILQYAPVCGDQQSAIRKVREAVMTANAAVALKGSV